MHFSVSVYQDRRPTGFGLTCVGLDGLELERVARSVSKAEAGLIKALKKLIAGYSPFELRRFDSKRGTQLKRIHMELTLQQGEQPKVSLSGLFPLIIEPRSAGGERELLIAYHPKTPDLWFPVVEDEPLESQAARYFGAAWVDLEQDLLPHLTSNGKDRLTVLAFNAEPKSLYEKIKTRSDVWADLELDPERTGGAPPKRGMLELPFTAQDLTPDLASQGPFESPHEPVRAHLAHLLCGSGRQSAILVGEPGVGKATAINALVQDLLLADDYPSHRNLDRVRHVWRLSGQRLIAGMSHLGQWEERAVRVLQDASTHPVVLYIDDLHAFGRIGRHRDSSRSLADFFKGPITRRQLAVIAACTPSELERLEYDAPGFADAFTRLNLPACDAQQALRLSFHKARALGQQRNASVEPFALRTLAELGGALLSGSELPGKILAPLEAIIGETDPEGTEERVIGAAEVLAYLSAHTGLPAELFEARGVLDSQDVSAWLQQRVMGQAEGVAAATDLVMRIRAGLTDGERPYAVYLLTGPTGTGKTELAKALTGYLYGDESRLIRLDMGELSGPDAARRMLGDRYAPRGLLTAPIQAQPFSVVLLDEIEKAHPAALYLLLQVFDAGRLTDASGAVADFTRSVILMTSNLGASARAPVGFGDGTERVLGDISRAVRDFFPPELFNRIDRVVPFAPLTRRIAESIVEAEVSKLLGRRGLTDNDAFVFVHQSALKQVVDVAFDSRDGARGVKRFLERHITSLLTDALARGGTSGFRVFRVYFAEGEYRLLTEELSEAETEPVALPLAHLLGASVSELASELPRTLELLDETLASGSVARLSADISQLASSVSASDYSAEQADTLFHTDRMRSEVLDLHDRLERMVGRRAGAHPEVRHPGDAPPRQLRGRSLRVKVLRQQQDLRSSLSARGAHLELFELHARAHFLRKALQSSDPAGHRVLVNLSVLGRERRRVTGQSEHNLMSALVGAFTVGPVELIEYSARLKSGRVNTADRLEGLLKLLERPPSNKASEPESAVQQVVLKLTGPAVFEYLARETGTHVWTSTAFGSELVRVTVDRAAIDTPSGALIEATLEQSLRFERALDEGLTPIPQNPLAILPLVRRLVFDPPPAGASRRAPLLVEDYRLGHTEELAVYGLDEGVRRCLWLGMGAVATPAEHPEQAATSREEAP